MEILRFVALLSSWQARLDLGDREALDRAGQVVEAEIKSATGTYRYGWPPLAPSTVARKGKDTPLLETGELRARSMEHTVVDARTCDVGSNDPEAVYHELGTSTIPPRSFLASGAMAKEGEVLAILSSGVTKILGGPGVP